MLTPSLSPGLRLPGFRFLVPMIVIMVVVMIVAVVMSVQILHVRLVMGVRILEIHRPVGMIGSIRGRPVIEKRPLAIQL